MKRCYKCRSRGELGDCRNPFVTDLDERNRASSARNPFLDQRGRDPYGRDQFDPYNQFDPFGAVSQRGGSLSSGVEAVPCSSGWCAKVIEGRGTFKADGECLCLCFHADCKQMLVSRLLTSCPKALQDFTSWSLDHLLHILSCAANLGGTFEQN